MEKKWYVYIVACRDGTLYTGITDDIPKRIMAHNLGKGAKYTRGRGPVILQYQEEVESYPHALRREHQIKQLSRRGKENLIGSQKGLL